jgi:hypothetical protein
LHTFLKGLGGSAAIRIWDHRLLAIAAAAGTVAAAIAALATAFTGVTGQSQVHRIRVWVPAKLSQLLLPVYVIRIRHYLEIT